MIFLKLNLVLVIILPIVLAQNYCNKNLCRKGKHIACNNNGKFAAICGSNPKIIQITPKLRQQILNKHNSLRNQIAKGYKNFKPAVRMATMVWNNELAKLAALNVKQCQMKHDGCRNTNSFRYAGQNLAMSGWSGMTKTVQNVADAQIQNWYDEYKDTTMAVIRSYHPNGKKIGHFTAMIQEKSTHVGCAISRYNRSNALKVQLMACNYAYTNVLSKPVYTSGKVASKCKTGVNPNYKFLCSTKEIYNVNSVI